MSASTWGSLFQPIAVGYQPTIHLLEQFFKPEEFVQIQLINDLPEGWTPRLDAAGVFNSPGLLAQSLYDYQGPALTAVFGLNPVRTTAPDTANVFVPAQGQAVGKREIVRRAVLPIRFVPVWCNLTEFVEALTLARQCSGMLELGNCWPAPVLVETSHSIDVLFALDLPHTPLVTDLVQDVLAILARQWNTDRVCIDTTAAAADLLCPLYSAPLFTKTIIDVFRHRPARILSLHDHVEPVTYSQLQQLRDGPALKHPTPVERKTDFSTLVQRFVQDGLKPVKSAWTPQAAVYRAFLTYCADNEEWPIPELHLMRQLETRFKLQVVQRQVDGTPTRGLQGIRLS